MWFKKDDNLQEIFKVFVGDKTGSTSLEAFKITNKSAICEFDSFTSNLTRTLVINVLFLKLDGVKRYELHCKDADKFMETVLTHQRRSNRLSAVLNKE
jgi:hypothetical protein